MAEGSSTNGEAGEGPSLWRGLRSLIFGEEAEPRLRDQIEEAIAGHDEDPPTRNGDLSPIERQMVRNLLHFGERDAGDVGVPRADIIAADEAMSFAELVALFANVGHSRVPVYRESLDTIIGMIHIRDVFKILATGSDHPDDLSGLIRQPIYVPESMGVLDLLAEMRGARTHLAVVLNEYSGTEGLITIEDLVEEIVGDIEDEHDETPTAMIEQVSPGVWDVDARFELEDAATEIDRALGEVDEDVETIGGLAFVLAGHVPQPGETLHHPSGWRIEITEGDSRRATRVRLHAPPRELDRIDLADD